MKILELFAGSRSIGNMAEKFGHQVCSVDVKAFEGIDIVMDIEELTLSDLPFIPDMIWASPPCTTFSIAAISHHRDGQIPKSPFAEKSDRLVKNTLKLIDDILIQKPHAVYYIENPRGMMRKMSYMENIPRVTITYCSYGDDRMKPTDIWSNNIRNVFHPLGWNPLPMCHNGNPHCHHQRAPRGSRTGTQGRANNYERSKLPPALCDDVIEGAFHSVTNNKSTHWRDPEEG
jgi:site-specific DNA-cytosine methylase